MMGGSLLPPRVFATHLCGPFLPAKAAIALDKLCVEMSESWDETIGAIMNFLNK
jgi:hypothetical protein